jgi:TPR repeat protein
MVHGDNEKNIMILSIAMTAAAIAAAVPPPSELPPGTKRWMLDKTVTDVLTKAPDDLPATVTELRKLEAAGNPQAMAVVAQYRYKGYGVWKDEAAACKDSMTAYKEGAPNAVVIIAPCLWDGKGTGTRQSQAQTAYKLLSDTWETYRYRDALTLMGQAQSMGLGTETDPRAAERTFRMAAQYGDGKAAYLLAKLYDHGQAGAHSPADILWLYREGALLGDLSAQVEIARRFRNDPKTVQEAYAWATKAAQGGEPTGLKLQFEIAAKMKEAGVQPDKQALRAINDESFRVTLAPIKLP